MKAALAALQTHLYNSNCHRPADLYAITLPSGTYYWTSCDRDVTYGGHNYSSTGPGLKRGRYRATARLEVASMDVTIVPGAVTVAGTPMLQAAVRGQFARATVTITRVFFGTDGSIIGGETMFTGGAVAVQPSTTELGLTFRSDLAMFEQQLPRRFIQASCPHQVYDTQTCKVAPAGFTDATKTVAAGTTTQVIQLSSASTMAVAGSIITVTGGALSGTKVLVASASGAACTLAAPTSSVLATGVTLSILRGCDQTRATCAGVFSNMLRFGGFPDAPQEV